MNPNDFQSRRTDEVSGEYDALLAHTPYRMVLDFDTLCDLCHEPSILITSDNPQLPSFHYCGCQWPTFYLYQNGVGQIPSFAQVKATNFWTLEKEPDFIKADNTPLPDLGDNGPVFAISDDGAEFLAAIEYLEKNPDRPYQYLGWQISSHGFYQAWKKDFYLRCIIARNLVTAIYTLEMNGVTEPATDDEIEVPQ